MPEAVAAMAQDKNKNKSPQTAHDWQGVGSIKEKRNGWTS